MKKRIKKGLRANKPRQWFAIAAAVFCLIFSACFMTEPGTEAVEPGTNAAEPETEQGEETESRESQKKNISLERETRLLVESYVTDVLRCIEDGNMRTFRPQEFATINGYLVAASMIDDRVTLEEQQGTGLLTPRITVWLLDCQEQEDGTILAGAEGNIFYSDGHFNHQIVHRYTVTLAQSEGEWHCVDIDARDDEKVLALKEKIAGMTYEEQIAYVEKELQSGTDAEDTSLSIRQAIFNYAETTFDSVNESRTAECSPEDYETANGYLAAKYYQTLREYYIEKGYPIKDHRVLGVRLKTVSPMESKAGGERLFAVASVQCSYTEPGLQTLQNYYRETEVILEKAGDSEYRVVEFNSIGAAAYELKDALRAVPDREEKNRYIDAHIKEAVINDGLLPMDNK